MGRVRREEPFWRECLERWAASGLSARESQLGRACVRSAGFLEAACGASAAVAVAGVSFAKVELESLRTKRMSDALEVVTRSGHMVRVGADFDEGALRRLLTVLGGA